MNFQRFGRWLLLYFFTTITGVSFLYGSNQPNLSVINLNKPKRVNILNYSGDQQYQTVNKSLPGPLRVEVTGKDGQPLRGIKIQFKVVSQPSKSEGFEILHPVTYTDSLGIAVTSAKLGSEAGEYFISAQPAKGRGNILIYNLHARSSRWLFFMLAGLIGGLSLFLYGMIIMSDGLKRAAGEKMRAILTGITNNRLIAVGIGALVTMIIQSSSATTVMLVGFVQSGLMSFAQSLGIILGADIGTTITAQIIAFKLTDYALLFIAAGFIIYIFFNDQKIKQAGKSILGFGMLFFAIDIMSEAMSPLRTFDPFIQVLLRLENPLWGILIGTIFTALLQSSSAFIGILIVISTQGVISLEASISLLLGANLGTAITAILASLNGNREAKRVALAHTLFKVFGILIFAWWIPAYANFIREISPQGNTALSQMDYMAQVVPRQIANAHTLFNISLTILVLPFVRKFAGLIGWILPDKPIPQEEVLEVKYLDENLIDSPALALSLAKQETIRMGHKVQDMVNEIVLPFFLKDPQLLNGIVLKEKQVNFLRDEINIYLRKITGGDIDENRVNEAFQIMYTVKEFEQMADLVSKNLIIRAEEWIGSNQNFTEQGKKELMEYHLTTQKQLNRAIEVFRDVNLEKARIMKAKYKKYRLMALDLEKQHYQRIKNEIKQSIDTSEMHLELMTSFRMITSHATNIARILLEWNSKNFKSESKKP